MALETLRGVDMLSGVKIAHSDGSIHGLAVKEDEYTVVDHENSRLHFQIQNGPIKEAGKNGCQVTDILRVCEKIYEGLNEKFPCDENTHTLHHLREAISYQDARTKNREERGVEGTSNA